MGFNSDITTNFPNNPPLVIIGHMHTTHDTDTNPKNITTSHPANSVICIQQ